MRSIKKQPSVGPIKNLRFLHWAPLATLLLMLALEQTKFFERINLVSENLRAELRYSLRKQPSPHPDLLLVGISENSLNYFGMWPWPRSIHGDFLQLLSLAPPAVVAWDILFVDKGNKDEDLGEGATIANVPVVTGALWQSATASEHKPADLGLTFPLTHVEGDIKRLPNSNNVLLPVAPLRDKSWFGCVNAEPQVDGVRHKIPLVLRYGNSLLPSLSLQTLMRYWNLSNDQIRVRLGDAIYIDSPTIKRRIPIDKRGWFFINYRYELQENETDSEGKPTKDARGDEIIKRKGFKVLDYQNLMQDLSLSYKKNTPLPKITGKILMVGQVAEGLSDLGPSPIVPISPLVLVHMNALNNILQEDYLVRVPPFWIWLLWLPVSYLTVAWMENKKFLPSIIIPSIMILAYTLAALALFTSKSVLIPITLPVLGFFLLNVGAIGRRVIVEEQDKRRMRMAFTAYLAPNVLEKIIENRQTLKLGGERREVAVLFSDLRGFTSLSESVGEEALVTQLNEYFTEMVDCVNRYGGTLHKFIGDAILAVWGDTLSEGPQHDCTNALKAALAMRAELVKLNTRWKAENRHPLKIGIGINRGNVIVGNIGAPQRMEFTVIGDTVNTASRLEGVTKQYKLDLVVSATFAEMVKDEFALQTLGLVRPPGKSHGVKIFHPMAELSGFSQENKDWLAAYEKGMDLYFDKKFSEALPIFEKCHELKPDNWPAEHHLTLCRHYIANPPDETWTGLRDVEK